MKNNKKLIPELRFPEFENEGEWEIKTLSGICDITNGKANAQDHVDNGRYPLFDRSEVIKASDEFIFDCEAVIIPGEGMRFIPKYYEGKFNLHQRAYALKDFSCSGQFVYYSMLHRSTLLSQKAVQSTVLSLRLPILQDFPIEIPKKPQEQQKIASCLSSLDEVIEAHSQKLELLKAHKKGLMQNLFPQEGEKVPKYRFKEFQGKWEKRFVEDFFSVGSSKRVLQKDWTIQGVPFYRTRELVSLSKNEPFGSEIFISEELFSKLSKKYGVPTEGDFLVSGVGTLGICYQVKTNDRFYFKDGNVIWFKLKKGISSTYFKFCFQSDYIQNQILKQASVSTVGTYTIQNAKKTTFWCPPTLTEQQKIASCLSSLDELIVAQAEKIEQLKQHKKGLIQGLFPKMND